MIPKKAIVTGGAGFIGSNLVDKLIDMGIQVSVIDDFSTGKMENTNKKAHYWKQDLSKVDIDELIQFMEGVDIVFHLAALARVQPSIEDPITFNKVNIDGTLNILDVIGLVQYIFGGNQNQAMAWLQSNFTEDEFKELTKGYFVSEKVLAWPNPSNAYVNLNGSGNTKIYDITGRLVEELELSGTYRWNTKTIPSGIYNIHNNMEITTITILK